MNHTRDVEEEIFSRALAKKEKGIVCKVLALPGGRIGEFLLAASQEEFIRQ